MADQMVGADHRMRPMCSPPCVTASIAPLGVWRRGDYCAASHREPRYERMTAIT